MYKTIELISMITETKKINLHLILRLPRRAEILERKRAREIETERETLRNRGGGRRER